MSVLHYRFVNVFREIDGEQIELCCVVYKDSVHALCSRYAKDLVSVSEPIFEDELCMDCAVIILKDRQKREDILKRVINGSVEDYRNGQPWISVVDVAHNTTGSVLVVGNLRIDLEI